MTVSSNYTDKVYQISGTSTVYPWAQELDTQYGSLVVTEETNSTDKEVVQTFVEGEDYNIVNKDVVFVTAPTDTDHYIRITRNTYRGQPVKFNEGEDFPAEDFEHSLDRFAMSQQEQDKALAEEKEARIKADEILQENIDAEAEARRNADITLQQNIDNEALARQNADVALQENIDAEETRAKAAEKAINDTLETFGDIVTHDADEFATAAQGAKADTAVQPADLSTVATTGSYNDLLDKPTNPTVSDATITLTQGGVTKGSFTLNQALDGTIALDAGGGGDTSVIEIYPVTVSIAEGSTSATVDVTSSVDLSKNYLPIAVFQEVSTTNVLKYCSYTHNNSAASVHFFSNGHIVGDLGVAVYLIPVESNLTTVRGLTNGLGEVTTAVADYVTTNTVQDILSRKTFFGEKAIYFKQTASTDKLGFTLYNEADLELGAFEFRPNTISGSAFLNVNTSSSINTLLGFRYWGNGNGTNIIAPKISAGNYYIPLKISDGTTTVQATDTGVVNIYSLLPTIVSSVSSASTNSEAVGAKLFYDTCGDIETLINAL